MKVLHVINTLETGGAERLLVDSLPKYKSIGVDVDLLCLTGGETMFFQELFSSFTGKITFLGVGSVYNPLYILKLRSYLRNYDLVHVHLFPSLYWVALAKFIFRLKVTLLFTEHSTNNRRIDHPFFNIVDRFIYGFYTRVTAITPQVKIKLMEKLNLKDQDCEVIYNGINLEKVTQAEAYPKSNFFCEREAFILIQVSRFQGSKDQQTLIRSLDSLPPYVKLILVGEGEAKGRCIALVEALGLSERVVFLGLRNDIPSLLKTADVVIQSSNWEGFGLAAIEGMAAGRPVVASGVPGLQEIIEGAGLIFRKGDEHDLSLRIGELIGSPSLYKLIAEKCRLKAQNYSIDLMVKQFKKLYEQVH